MNILTEEEQKKKEEKAISMSARICVFQYVASLDLAISDDDLDARMFRIQRDIHQTASALAKNSFSQAARFYKIIGDGLHSHGDAVIYNDQALQCRQCKAFLAEDADYEVPKNPSLMLFSWLENYIYGDENPDVDDLFNLRYLKGTEAISRWLDIVLQDPEAYGEKQPNALHQSRMFVSSAIARDKSPLVVAAVSWKRKEAEAFLKWDAKMPEQKVEKLRALKDLAEHFKYMSKEVPPVSSEQFDIVHSWSDLICGIASLDPEEADSILSFETAFDKRDHPTPLQAKAIDLKSRHVCNPSKPPQAAWQKIAETTPAPGGNGK